jgi:hypothetical protein
MEVDIATKLRVEVVKIGVFNPTKVAYRVFPLNARGFLYIIHKYIE